MKWDKHEIPCSCYRSASCVDTPTYCWAIQWAHYRLNNSTEGALHTGWICDLTLYQFEVFLLSEHFCNVWFDLWALIVITYRYQDNLKLDWRILCVYEGAYLRGYERVCLRGYEGSIRMHVFEGVWRSVFEGYEGYTTVCVERGIIYMYRHWRLSTCIHAVDRNL